MQQDHMHYPHHFTASALVLCNNHLLLIDHKRIGAWVPPGGHIEETETPDECVVREVLEETGVHIEIIGPPRPNGDSEAFFLAAPLYVQAVTAIENGQHFYHIDLAYLCRPAAGNRLDAHGLPELTHNREVKRSRWVPWQQIGSLKLAKNVAEALALLEDNATAFDWPAQAAAALSIKSRGK